MIKEITKKEFERRFPSVSTYGFENYSPIYLDCGDILLETDWNGERYETNGTEYYPIYEVDLLDIGSAEVVGYEVVGYEVW